jgi:hypothetical protein
VSGRNVSVETESGAFRLNVSSANRSATGPIPSKNETIAIGGLEFVNEDGRIYAINGTTRVRVAQAETYS